MTEVSTIECCDSRARMEEAFVARQPIYDRALNLYAYELLFRAGAAKDANVIDGDSATSDVIVNAIIDIGLHNVVEHYPAFINMTREFLTGHLPIPLMKEQVVIEVLEDIVPDDEIVRGLKALSDSGYVIALDDFVFRPELRVFLDIAHIVKLDVMAMNRGDVESHLRLLQDYPVKLLAEKVETREEFEWLHEMGFDYFQGYFFCQPKIVSGKRPEGCRLVILELVAMLQEPSLDSEDLVKVISRDASLAYRLLRYVNSSFFGLRSTVDSIQHTLTLLGPAQVKQWASLILMVRLADEKPPELLVTGMIRAKMCELLGCKDAAPADQYFTVGLFSILDALMDLPLDDALKTLPLAEEMKSALTQYSGPLGSTLRGVMDYEQGNWGRLDADTSVSYSDAYLRALQWHRDSRQTL